MRNTDTNLKKIEVDLALFIFGINLKKKKNRSYKITHSHLTTTFISMLITHYDNE